MSQAYYGISVLGMMFAFGCADPAPEFAPLLDNAVVDTELSAPLELAVDRWVAATCLPLKINGTGVAWRVALEPMLVEAEIAPGVLDMVAADGLTVPGYEAPEEVFIASYVMDKDFAVMHELGHRLGMDHNLSNDPDVMSQRRVVNRTLGLRWSHLGEQSLSAVCSVQDCGCFNPESGPVPL